ncbi:MAG: TonB-dependent receptor [Robiginitomaculum sp.]|nr:MAG: TonB-dependent receptor [Robiginitomaculum sp.]
MGPTAKSLLLTSAIAMCLNATASAQSILKDEIIVTAQKRTQNLQDVPIAITAYTGDQMDALGVVESVDIAKFTPGVHIGGALAGQNTQFTIRGVNQNDFNDIVEAPNAVYVDEGYIAISQAQTFATLDIERVEILKGPQGTLFGRNATGGLVHYLSRQPNHDEAEGFIKGSYTFFDSPNNANAYNIEGAVSTPLSDKLAARLAFKLINQDGYLENLYDPAGANVGGSPGVGAGADLGGFETIVGRGILSYQASDRVNFRLTVAGSSSDLSTGPYQSKPTIAVYDANGELIDVRDVAVGETRATIGANGQDLGTDLDNNGVLGGAGEFMGRFAPGGDFFGYRDPDGADFTTSSDFAFEDHGNTDNFNVNGRMQWEMESGIELTVISDYKTYEKLLFVDVDSAPVNQSANYAAVDATSFTQEIRLSGTNNDLDWVAGYYYLNIDNDSDNGLKFPANSVVPGAPFDLGTDAQLKTNSHSIFAQGDYQLSDQVSMTFGGRVIFENKEFDLVQGLYFGNADPFSIHVGNRVNIGPVNGAPISLESSDTLWAGKMQIDWRPNDDTLIYAGINRGVKAGSFNAPLAGGLALPAGTGPYEYEAEVLWSYEGGFKLQLGANTRVNGSVYYYDYNDYQAFLFTGVGGVVINADAENYGVELEIQSNPMEGLDLIFTGAYFNATVKDVPFRVGTSANIISRDVNPTNSPELQIMGLARYSWPVWGGNMAVQGSASYSDEFYYNLRNFSADIFESYVMVDARIGWESPDDKWGVALRLNNITDTRAGIQGFDLATLCGCNEVSYQAPRSISVDVNYNF